MRPIALPLVAACLLLSACQSSDSETPAAAEAAETEAAVPGDTADTAPYSEIAEDEVLRFLGNEPFWGGEVSGKTLTYKTPEDQDGTVIAVERFSGRGGIALSGLLDGAEFEMTVTSLKCSDGMSDRTYPFTVTLKIGEDRRNGCAWSDQHPFEGPANP